jgi:hypothetical protein
MAVKKNKLHPEIRQIYDLTNEFLQNVLTIYERDHPNRRKNPSDDNGVHTYTKMLCTAWQSAQATEEIGAQMVYTANDMCEKVLDTDAESAFRIFIPLRMKQNNIADLLNNNEAEALAALCRPRPTDPVNLYSGSSPYLN